MLACARIGAIHSVVFGGFSASALRGRIQDCGAKMLITADEGIRGGRKVPLKAAADEALFECPTRRVVRRRQARHRRRGHGAGPRHLVAPGDRRARGAQAGRRAHGRRGPAVHPVHVRLDRQAEGRAAHHGRLPALHEAHLQTVFDYRDEDVFWCTADIGWVTGHSYIVYGPLAAGATTLMFEGIPTYPDPGRFWSVVEKYRVNDLLHRADAIRALMRHGEGWPQRYDLSSPPPARHRGRADQPRGLDVVPRVIGGEPADRRHLLADGDRRLPHHAVAGRDAAQARLGDRAVLRRGARGRARGRQPRGPTRAAT